MVSSSIQELSRTMWVLRELEAMWSYECFMVLIQNFDASTMEEPSLFYHYCYSYYSLHIRKCTDQLSSKQTRQSKIMPDEVHQKQARWKEVEHMSGRDATEAWCGLHPHLCASSAISLTVVESNYPWNGLRKSSPTQSSKCSTIWQVYAIIKLAFTLSCPV